MTLSNNAHFASIFAAVICAIITIGTSVAPALSSVSPYVA